MTFIEHFKTIIEHFLIDSNTSFIVQKKSYKKRN